MSAKEDHHPMASYTSDLSVPGESSVDASGGCFQIMSAGGPPTLYVTTEISSQAQLLLSRGTGSSTRDGIELLLVNGIANSNPSHDTNAGSLLQRGLAFLSNSPYESLDISSHAELSEVKKAYKRFVPMD
jgi:hypothetical protein